jgi:hypothetical protein
MDRSVLDGASQSVVSKRKSFVSWFWKAAKDKQYFAVYYLLIEAAAAPSTSKH